MRGNDGLRPTKQDRQTSTTFFPCLRSPPSGWRAEAPAPGPGAGVGRPLAPSCLASSGPTGTACALALVSLPLSLSLCPLLLAKEEVVSLRTSLLSSTSYMLESWSAASLMQRGSPKTSKNFAYSSCKEQRRRNGSRFASPCAHLLHPFPSFSLLTLFVALVLVMCLRSGFSARPR